jgi:ABC-type Fe3+ transport system permease subunit
MRSLLWLSDELFYGIYQFERNVAYGGHHVFGAISMVAVFYLINIMTILSFLDKYIFKGSLFDSLPEIKILGIDFFGGIIFVGINAILFWYYRKNRRYRKVISKREEEAGEKKRTRVKYIVGYVLITIILLVVALEI